MYKFFKKHKLMKKTLTIGELNSIYQKYGDLSIKVNTPYGYKNILWCGITEENADVYRCELEDGKYVEGADYHRLKKYNGEFIVLKDVGVGELIQTVDGISKVKYIELMNLKDTLYDIQVDEVHQYYSNGIVSHNTTLTIDTIKFLLHGNTTKTDKNEEIFNTYSDKNELIVRGMIEINGNETIIERKMRRTAKKGGGWTITNKVNYYTMLPDGTEESHNDEQSKATSKIIKETIGSEKDFEMLVLATEKNLDDLIGLTTTESGKILTRLIGLEVIEMKEVIVRKMYNEFDKKKKSNEYDIFTLSNEIDDHKEGVEMTTQAGVNLKTKLVDIKEQLVKLSEENDRLLNSKNKIDSTITSLNPSKLEAEIKEITEKAIGYKDTITVYNNELNEMGEVHFNEDEYLVLTKKLSTFTSSVAVIKSEISNLERTIKSLVDGGICQSCNRKLDNIDNTEHIAKHSETNNENRRNLVKAENSIITLQSEIETLDVQKKKVEYKNKIELNRDRLEVEVAGLRNTAVSKKNDLNKYNLNLKAIELNTKIDIDLSKVKTDIAVTEYAKDDALLKIQKVDNEHQAHVTNIESKTKIISTIEKENEVDKLFKVYIEIVGKKGISKLVLRSVLPIINSETQRLLEDVCNFEVEIFIDDKNEVQFLINEDDVTKQLKSGSGFEKTVSSLALRAVLGKLSILPMPNFITFDEVMGKVANDNLEKLKPLFEKIKDMYEIVFLITHNDLVKDWSENLITVVKDNHLSKISFKK